MSRKIQYTDEDINRAANSVRKRALRITIDTGGCYVGQACSSAEILMTLYMRVLNLGESLGSPVAEQFAGSPGPENPNPKRGGLYHGPTSDGYDRYIISIPQYAVAVYSALVECGRLEPGALDYFGKDGWNMEMIPADHSPGYDTMTGSLSQTISIAAGTAHARKLKGEAGRVVTITTDGESEEGQVWEAIQSAVALKLDNLVVYLDANGQQCEGETEGILGLTAQDYVNRFRAFGAETVLVDGHDINALAGAADTPHTGRPLVIVCRTDCTRGIPLLEKKRPNLHYISFGKDERSEIEAFYAQM